MKKLSGVVSKRGSRLSVRNVAKLPFSPGTAVPGPGVPTAAMSSPTHVILPLKAGLSHLVRWLSRSLYADTLLSIHQIAQLSDAVYDTVHTAETYTSSISTGPDRVIEGASSALTKRSTRRLTVL